ncbi:DNA mismatch repair endonuclease MutL [Lachnoanaerobaculum sp. OBRC5-5]|uniref:DNA mismatch repair endonuclease MutL n=1 Tax=Lachnoanaerobaculum sp. OBRC5-5 TaxID=936595 RepID=UPI000282559F|nr:DNA mismatch repair endonuclease MutL [Lachnoanaerobaculum sp. OBRC5-5]EJZ70695.1 DNA mismatch repair protein MutL [Lachnoanaerobaculum sp. OBRC5-5]
MINILDKGTIDKIAAGEVVERPASIVKELLENSIDAGSSSITVEIKNGGIDLIRITDNGCGIDSKEVKTAFLRHATSKIVSDKDLISIKSLGFRGEALSSIAAVSRCEIITKTRDELTGVRYYMEGGVEVEFEEIGAPDGTSIIIRDIFYNTPARRKFLKTASTEGAHISELVEKMAMSNTDIAFKFISNNQVKLQTNGNGNLKDIIYQLYGKEISKALCAVDYEKDGVKIKGVIARPEVTRSSRSLENIFVNGRYIKDNIISKAIEDGFGDRLMQHQYPFCALSFYLEGVDVNVHPRKMEVRFSDGNHIYNCTKEAVEEIFKLQSSIREVPVGKDTANEKKVFINTPEPFENRRRDIDFNKSAKSDEIQWTIPKETNYNPQNDYTLLKDDVSNNSYDKSTGYYRDFEYAAGARDVSKDSSSVIQTVENSAGENISDNLNTVQANSEADTLSARQSASQLSFFDTEAKKYIKVIGQVFDTYWIVQLRNEMYIIDQHAAHEKVMYERLLKESKDNKISSQMINPPIIVTLTDLEQDVLIKHMDEFRAVGFDIEEFGGKEYKINSIPNIFPSIPKAELFNEMLADSTNYDIISPSELILAKTASMACKAAIKGNMRISLMEANDLFDELLSLDNPYNCPHGRPTIIKMSKQEIEKKFKRIV